jgi:hypothetical protein
MFLSGVAVPAKTVRWVSRRRVGIQQIGCLLDNGGELVRPDRGDEDLAESSGKG